MSANMKKETKKSRNLGEDTNISSALSIVDPKENLKKNNRKINEKKQKLLKILQKIDENLLQICDSLIENIAFMSVTLDSLMEKIKTYGVKEYYQNGATQTGYKKSVEIEVYNVMQKNYQSSMKLLIDLLSSKGDVDDESKEELKKYFMRPRNSIV